jgi:hypothetical protein
MRPHWWWWRPGRVPGRRLYAWHLTFGDQTVSRGRAELRRVVSGYQARLGGLPGLDLVPFEWLHLTVQAVGLADEVDAGDAGRIVAAVRRRCAALAPVRLTLGPAVLQAEGVWLPVAPPAAARADTRGMRAAHRLSEVDRRHHTAFCVSCGPTVIGRSLVGRWRCGKELRELRELREQRRVRRERRTVELARAMNRSPRPPY